METMKRVLQIALALGLGLFVAQTYGRDPSARTVRRKLKEIVIPRIRFEEVPVRQAIEVLRNLAKENDPDGRGVNLVLLESAEMKNKVLTAEMDGVPVDDALRFMCMGAGLDYRVEDHAVVISPLKSDDKSMSTRFYTIASWLFDGNSGKDAESVRNFFATKGITFPEGSNVSYHRRSNKLIVHNTAENQRKMERLLQELQQ